MPRKKSCACSASRKLTLTLSGRSTLLINLDEVQRESPSQAWILQNSEKVRDFLYAWETLMRDTCKYGAVEKMLPQVKLPNEMIAREKAAEPFVDLLEQVRETWYNLKQSEGVTDVGYGEN